MHFFTSINLNYLAKARVLAESVKRYHPESQFTLMLCERPGTFELDLSAEPFDQIILVGELPIPAENLEAWIFGHSVVELCTAVKPFAAREIFNRAQSDHVVYLDPDIEVFHDLSFITERLMQSGVLLTPHLLSPVPSSHGEVRLHEISCLKHGVYNLGFIAIHRSRGQAFLDWWCDRLLHYCRDDIAQGLFTDQRWIDLAPALFSEVEILRDISCNVASWNVSRRQVSIGRDDQYCVQNVPLKFFHFSGFDAGTHDKIIELLQPDNSALKQLTHAYRARLIGRGQAQYASYRWSFGYFNNGQKISHCLRIAYRDNAEMQRRFPSPFSSGEQFTFHCWGEMILWKHRAQSFILSATRLFGINRFLQKLRQRAG